jgi:ABC-2 type transport system permease protein
MRSFADEKTGNAGITLTKPLSLWQIVNGKFRCVATDCTGHYSNIHLCESNIQSSNGRNIDMGSTIGSYAD